MLRDISLSQQFILTGLEDYTFSGYLSLPLTESSLHIYKQNAGLTLQLKQRSEAMRCWAEILLRYFFFFQSRSKACLPKCSSRSVSFNVHDLESCRHKGSILFSSLQFSSVAQSCPTLFSPMDCNTPGFPVHHQLLAPTQTQVH